METKSFKRVLWEKCFAILSTELIDTRKMLELGALNYLWEQPQSTAIWTQLKGCYREFSEFSELHQLDPLHMLVFQFDQILLSTALSLDHI